MTNKEATSLILGLEGTETVMTAENRVSVTKNGLTLSAFYNAETDKFGFDMLNGSQKTCSNFEELQMVMNTYFFINTVFIPNAKKVVLVFQKLDAVNVDAVYNNFKGSSHSGWIAVFNVIGDSTKEIQVRIEEDVYHAIFIDKDSLQVSFEMTYILGNNDEPVIENTIKNHSSMLYSLYMTSTDYNIVEKGDGSYSVSRGSNSLTFEVANTENNSYRFIINDTIEYFPKNPYDLAELFDFMFKSPEDIGSSSENDGIKDALEAGINMLLGKDKEESIEDVKSLETDDKTSEPVVEETDENDESWETDVEGNADGISQSSKESMDDWDSGKSVETDGDWSDYVESAEDYLDSSNSSEPVEEPIETIEEDPRIGDTLSFSIKLIYKDGEKAGVLVCYEDKLLKAGIDDFRNQNFPIDSISEQTQLVKFKGLDLTEEEVSRKCFAKDIKNNVEAVCKVIEDFFS